MQTKMPPNSKHYFCVFEESYRTIATTQPARAPEELTEGTHWGSS